MTKLNFFQGVGLALLVAIVAPLPGGAVEPDCHKLFPDGFNGGWGSWQWAPTVERTIALSSCQSRYTCKDSSLNDKYGYFGMSWKSEQPSGTEYICDFLCQEPTKVTSYEAGRHVTYHFGPSTCTNTTFGSYGNITRAQVNVDCGATSFYVEDAAIVDGLLNVTVRAPCGPDPPALSPVDRSCHLTVPTVLWSGFLNSTTGADGDYFDWGYNVCSDDELVPGCPRGFLNAYDTKNGRRLSITNYDGMETVDGGWRAHYSNDIGTTAVVTMLKNGDGDCKALEVPAQGVNSTIGGNGAELFTMEFQCV